MQFMPVFVEKLGDEARIKVLMCLEPFEEEPNEELEGLDCTAFERVQLMDCDIGEGQ